MSVEKDFEVFTPKPADIQVVRTVFSATAWRIAVKCDDGHDWVSLAEISTVLIDKLGGIYGRDAIVEAKTFQNSSGIKLNTMSPSDFASILTPRSKGHRRTLHFKLLAVDEVMDLLDLTDVFMRKRKRESLRVGSVVASLEQPEPVAEKAPVSNVVAMQPRPANVDDVVGAITANVKLSKLEMADQIDEIVRERTAYAQQVVVGSKQLKAISSQLRQEAEAESSVAI